MSLKATHHVIMCFCIWSSDCSD